ncbi:MAG: ATP-binding protein [Vitreimonas sp.]
MRRTVERELARARLRHHDGSIRPVPVSPLVDSIMRTLSRTPRGEPLVFENSLDDDAAVALHPDDLAELLGNLLENATRAAQGRVRVAASRNDGFLTVSIDDDGKAADPEEMERLTGRGMRQDESGGAGLGLAIVGDILAACGGHIGFARSSLGGLSVRLALPGRSR